ncbi:hypothetical protein MAR_011043 [Mya arenaria]|uniref:Uncharacterized protein n=1 Tax=Mya arenaria TaxID=6604 RepID=A0ABY7FWS8_MYAAR|nr:hypothetical protein MAR_011043 [Mya arenaria]
MYLTLLYSSHKPKEKIGPGGQHSSHLPIYKKKKSGLFNILATCPYTKEKPLAHIPKKRTGLFNILATCPYTKEKVRLVQHSSHLPIYQRKGQACSAFKPLAHIPKKRTGLFSILATCPYTKEKDRLVQHSSHLPIYQRKGIE